MSHLVIIAAPIGPVVRRFTCPVQFANYTRRFYRDGSFTHWPKTWVNPFELRVSMP